MSKKKGLCFRLYLIHGTNAHSNIKITPPPVECIYCSLRCTFKPPPVIILAFYRVHKPKAIPSPHQDSLERACNLSGEEALLLIFQVLLSNSPKR